MQNTARDLAQESQVKVIGHINLPQTTDVEKRAKDPLDVGLDDFLTGQVEADWHVDLAKREFDRVLAEIAELQAENRWQDIVALFYPVAEKAPELVRAGLDTDVRIKVSFALGRVGRHDEAIEELQRAVEKDPKNSLAHYSIGYVALDAFYQTRTSRRILPAKRRAELAALAHYHFDQATQLRPASVTYHYRHAVFYKEIEDKPKKAVPLFTQAIANWCRLSVDEQHRLHQQRPKYIKSMYHLASCLLALDKPSQSLDLLHKVMEEDRDRNHMHPLFKHFALGKVLHTLGRYTESLHHLETAAQVAERGQATDFVWELAARNAHRLGNLDKAMSCINRVESSRRRPYIQWTEADILVGLGKAAEALRVLQRSASADRRSRHKALIRMARIYLSQGVCDKALDAAQAAVRFCRENYGNPPKEGRFWEAVSLYRLGRSGEALPIIDELEAQHFQQKNFSRLVQLVRSAGGAAAPQMSCTTGKKAGR